MYDVLCVGSATVDHFLTINQKLSSVKMGDKIVVPKFVTHTGGGATNSAVSLRKLGLRVKIFTKLGNDHDATFVERKLKEYNIKNICCHYSKKCTDFATIISSTREKDRIIYVHKGASQDLSLDDCSKRSLKANWIYLASLVGKSLKTGKKIASLKKGKLLFNPSLYLAKKGKNFLRPILRETEVLVLNQEEAKALLKSYDDSRRSLLSLRKLGPKTIVITNGAKKLYALHEGNFYSLMPPKVKVVHTAGAGDAFTSGLLAGLIKRKSFQESLILGQINAASVIQELGTKNGLLNLEQYEKLKKRYKIKVNVS